MPEGYDHDFEVPTGAFRTLFSRLAGRWPEGIAQLYGGVLVPFAAVADRAVDTLGDGFSAYRNAAARERSHNEGGFVDADGESSLDVFLRGDATWLHVDLVFDNNGSPAFSLAVHEAVGRGISKALRAKPSPEWTPMDRAWCARTLDALRPPHIPGGLIGRERALFIALACWHRVHYEDEPHLTYTQPPGRLIVVDGRLEFEPDDAGPSPKVQPW
jgi:hypothetical protein